MLDRNDILSKAYMECMTEMYAKAQPSVDFIKLNEDLKNGIITESNADPIHDRYYLSQEEFHYILNKYCNAYGMTESWKNNMETVTRYFSGEGYKDVWVSESIDDEGFKHPGYRTVEEVPHIEKVIAKKYGNEIAKDISKIVFNYLNECKDFYRFDREKNEFSASIALGCSPTSNKKTVIKYWKSQGVDIVIEDRNPMYFWDREYYGDDFDEEMKEVYGDNYEAELWKHYYNSPDGKKKLVNDYINDNQETNPNLQKMFVRGKDNNMYVYSFIDESETPIDEFIEKYNITWESKI